MVKKIMDWFLPTKVDPDYEIIRSEFTVKDIDDALDKTSEICSINGVRFYNSENIKVQYKGDWGGGVLVYREGRIESNKGWCVLDGAYDSRSLDQMDAIQKIKSETYEKA